MARVLVAVDPALGVSSASLAAAWNTDPEGRPLGTATVAPAGGETFLPGVVALVAIPFAVSAASSVLAGVVERLIHRLRTTAMSELAITEMTSAKGDRILMVRSGHLRP